MFSLRNTLGTVALVSALALAACNSDQGGTNKQPNSSTTATASTGMVKALTSDQVNVHLALQGEPALSADGQNIAVTVSLKNDGTTLLSSAGKLPVNLGAHSVDGSGQIINNDLARASLPDIAPGTTANVTILLPIAGTINHSAQILPVQEGVAWFDTWGTKPVTVGPFSSCSNAADGKVCDANGKPLAPTAAH